MVLVGRTGTLGVRMLLKLSTLGVAFCCALGFLLLEKVVVGSRLGIGLTTTRAAIVGFATLGVFLAATYGWTWLLKAAGFISRDAPRNVLFHPRD